MAVNTSFTSPASAFLTTSKVASSPLAPKSPLEKMGATPSVTPQESFVSTSPLKTARPGSDMALMVEDLQGNGFIPQSEPVSPELFEARPLKEARPGSDMAQMVADLKMSGSHHAVMQVTSSGAIMMLEEFPHQDGGLIHSNHDGSHSGHHPSHQGDALLGGHLSTEVIEQMGHHASHGTHAATQVAGHGAQVGGDIAAVGHHGAHGTQALGEALNQAADAGHEVSNAVHHGVAEALGETAVTAGSKAAHGASQVAHHLSTGMEVALGFGSVASGALAVPLVYNGVKELKAGIKEKDAEKTLEGVGNLAVGTRSAAAATVMAGMLTTSEVVTAAAGVASQVLTPLGIVHGVIDGVLGIKDVINGKTTEGLMKIGVGVAVTCAALGGGLPATLAAGAFLGGKVVYKMVTKHQDKKAAEAAAAEQATTPKDGETKTTEPTSPGVSASKPAETVSSPNKFVVPNSDFYADYSPTSGGKT